MKFTREIPEIPTRPVDEKTGDFLEIPEGATMPEVEGEPGVEAEIDVKDLPEIEGYDKPVGENGKIQVKIKDDGKGGKVYDVPYTPAETPIEDKKSPTRPIDGKTGEEINLPEGKTMPELEGKPGDEVEIDVNELPDIPGYDKPKGDKNGKIKVTIPENGVVDFCYTPIEYGKSGQSEQNNNGSNHTPEKGKSKDDVAYPNTGSETNLLISALGAVMLALTGVFVVLVKRRNK